MARSTCPSTYWKHGRPTFGRAMPVAMRHVERPVHVSSFRLFRRRRRGVVFVVLRSISSWNAIHVHAWTSKTTTCASPRAERGRAKRRRVDAAEETDDEIVRVRASHPSTDDGRSARTAIATRLDAKDDVQVRTTPGRRWKRRGDDGQDVGGGDPDVGRREERRNRDAKREGWDRRHGRAKHRGGGCVRGMRNQPRSETKWCEPRPGETTQRKRCTNEPWCEDVRTRRDPVPARRLRASQRIRRIDPTSLAQRSSMGCIRIVGHPRETMAVAMGRNGSEMEDQGLRIALRRPRDIRAKRCVPKHGRISRTHLPGRPRTHTKAPTKTRETKPRERTHGHIGKKMEPSRCPEIRADQPVYPRSLRCRSASQRVGIVVQRPSETTTGKNIARDGKPPGLSRHRMGNQTASGVSNKDDSAWAHKNRCRRETIAAQFRIVGPWLKRGHHLPKTSQKIHATSFRRVFLSRHANERQGGWPRDRFPQAGGARSREEGPCMLVLVRQLGREHLARCLQSKPTLFFAGQGV